MLLQVRVSKRVNLRSVDISAYYMFISINFIEINAQNPLQQLIQVEEKRYMDVKWRQRLEKAQRLILSKENKSKQAPNYTTIYVKKGEMRYSSLLNPFDQTQPESSPYINLFVSNSVTLHEIRNHLANRLGIDEKQSFQLFMDGVILNDWKLNVSDLKKRLANSDRIEITLVMMESF